MFLFGEARVAAQQASKSSGVQTLPSKKQIAARNKCFMATIETQSRVAAEKYSCVVSPVLVCLQSPFNSLRLPKKKLKKQLVQNLMKNCLYS